MKNHRMLACASAFLLLTGAATAEQATPAAKPAPAAPTAPVKMTPPIRGTAELGIMKPLPKRVGGEVVTTFKVKNMSTTNAIVGLKIDEFWYDKAGNPVTGDTFRSKKPLQPQEVLEFQLHTPINPKMDRNQYKFSHANGDIKATMMPKL